MFQKVQKIVIAIFALTALTANAQTFYNFPVTTASSANAFPLNSTTSNKVQTIYAPGTFKDGSGVVVGAGNNITKVYFKFATVNATTVYTSITISMGQTAGVVDSVFATGATTFATGLTTVYNQSNVSLTGIVANQWYGFTLSTPFNYNPALSLIIEVKSNHTASGGNANANVSVAPGNVGSRRRFGAYASATGSIGTGYVITAIDVTPNSVCTSPPTAGTNSISPTTICSGGNISFNLTGNSTGSGQTYVWKKSSTLAGTYTAISGSLTSPVFSYSSLDSGFYKCDVTCSGNTQTTAATKVSVIPGLAAGTYTINSAVATGGTNFQSFTAAVNAMNCGVQGPVVFNVAPGSGPYNEQVVIPAILNTSSVNTVTFNGNGNVLTSAGGTSYATLDLNGADYVRFNNLTINATHATLGFGVHLWNGANNNIFDSCNINVNTTAAVTTCMGVVMSGSTTVYSTQGANGSNNLFKNCNVVGGYSGFSFYGESAGVTNNSGNSIVNCRISEYYIYGSYNIYQGSGLISKNIFERPTRTGVSTTYGVMLTTGCLNMTVERNKIRNLFGGVAGSTVTCYPLYCTSTSASAGNENKFFNNVISDINTAGPIYGMYLLTATYVKAYYNSIVLNDISSTATGLTYGVYSTSTSGAGLDFKNNNIHIERGGTGTKYCMYYTATLVVSNYNNLYMNSPAGTNAVGFYSTAFTTLANWQTANSGAWDANSKSVNPVYSSPLTYNYTPTTALLNDKGITVADVNVDIDSVTRGALPDIGAYEFTVGPLDASISWVAPAGVQTSGSKTIQVKILNASTDTIKNLVLNYTDGTTVTTQGFGSLLLAAGDTQTLSFTTNYNLSSSVSLRAFISSVNGGLDFVRGNDTTAWQDICVAMDSGTYTINSALPTSGTNFQTFNDAVNALSCGIAGPVIFNVVAGSGPYNEQVDIPVVLGTSATNTITINGNGNELINAGSVTNYATLNLNGASRFTFNNLKITTTGATNGFAVHLMGNASYNTFNGCTITASLTATGSTSGGISISGSKTVYSTAGTNANNTLINNCTIIGGYFGVAFYGNSSSYLFNENNSITNSTIKEYYVYGSYNIYQGNSTISNNIIERPTRPAVSTGYGIILTTGCVNVLVEKNRIRNLYGGMPSSSSTTYCLYNSSTSASFGLENKFYNNTVSDIKTTGSIYGMYLTTATYVKIYHNTFNFDDVASTGGLVYGVYSTAATPTGIDIQNNNINITKGGTGTKYCVYLAGPATCDYNNLYVNSPLGTNAVGFFGAAFTTLADWQLANGSIWDQNSVSLVPNFLNVSLNNLKPTNTLMDNLGTNVGITTDIVGKTRSGSTPDMGAYEIDLYPTDLGALYISSTNPGFNGCYDSAQTISVMVQNFGTDTLRFGITPATVTCYISGAIMDTVVGNITDSLLPGATKWVTITAGVNMTALGTYNIIARTNIAGDGDTANDMMSVATSRTAVNLTKGTISTSFSGPYCLTASPTINITGQAGANIQWQTTTDTTLSWNNVGTLNSTSYIPSSPFTQNTYVRVKEYCNSIDSVTNNIYFTLNSPVVVSTIGDTVCNSGAVTLSATTSGTPGPAYTWWYNGNSITDTISGTGNTYSVPNVTATKNFYVVASSGAYINGNLLTSYAGGNSSSANFFDVIASNNMNITGLDLNCSSTIGTSVTIQVWMRAGTVVGNANTTNPGWVLVASGNILSAGVGNPTNFTFPIGTTIPLQTGVLTGLAVGFTTGSLTYTNSAAGAALAGTVLTSNADLTIKCGYGGTFTGSIIDRNFNGRLYYSAGCISAKTPVQALVLQAPKITAPRELGYCLPGSASTQVDSSNVYNTYSWSPNTNISASGNNVTFNPTSTTLYTVTATQNSGLSCTSTAQIVVKAHANPVPNITDRDTIYCQSNDAAEISVLSTTNKTANNWSTILYQSFDAGLNGWSITNDAGRNANSVWMLRKTPATVGTQTFNFDTDSCIVAFNDSSNTATSTYLNVPSISTIGYDSLRMVSKIIYDYASGDSLIVQASINGGSTWANVPGTFINFDVSLGNSAGAVLGFNLPMSYINLPNLMLRMRSLSNNGFVVGMDNILVEGKKHATFNWTSSLGGYTSNREDSVQVRPTADAYIYLQMIDSISGCSGTDSAIVRKGLVDPTRIFIGGTVGGVDSLEATCNDESTGWTYYSGTGSLPSNNFYFAINWDTNYTARSMSKAKIGTTANYLVDTSDPSGTFKRGTWVMRKYWNVDLNGSTLGTPVKVRFYFNPSDSADISNAADAYVNQYLAVPFRPWLEPFTWFKTITGEYIPGANLDSSGVEVFNNIKLNVEKYGSENGAHYVQFQNVTSFSGGSGASGAGIGTPLPVEMLYFNAKAVSNGNYLTWATASEKNNSHFEIESSIDGIHFNTLGRVEGAGNSAEMRKYDFTDATPAANKTYYRLKQVDFDGVFEYSQIKVVSRDGKIVFDALVYPIPARENINIDILSNDKGVANITITDITGKEVRSEQVNVSLGNTRTKMDISDLNSGNYVITIDNGMDKINRKFVKVK